MPTPGAGIRVVFVFSNWNPANHKLLKSTPVKSLKARSTWPLVRVIVFAKVLLL